MPNTGFTFPGTAVNIVLNQSAWVNPSRVVADDGSYASLSWGYKGEQTSDILKARNFGFAIPTENVISGVVARIGRYASQGTVTEMDLRLLVGDVAIGNNKAGAFDTAWSTSEVAATYGSETDLWGLALTPAQVNSSNFGIQFQTKFAAEVYVDYIQLDIYHDVATQTWVRDGGVWKRSDKYVRDSGIWKPATGYVRDSSVWKPV